MTEASRTVLTVSELTRRIKATLEQGIGHVWVEGELSNVKRPASGHLYFTIKDATSQISGVLFRGNQRGMGFEPADGMQVRATGDISVYEQRGNYQIIVRRMEQGGKGALQERFEKLKQQLKEEGLFDSERKKTMPLLPQHVGVVTSATGAAIRDILNVVSRRFPNLHLLLAPVKVQGEAAAGEIAAAIDALNAYGGLDVLIVGRGGGSLEDLWAFNEETVARAIARSDVPVISAVGHEIDFTISDFTADLRAPTPSAAAELVVGRKDEFVSVLEDLSRRLGAPLQEWGLRARHRLEAAGQSYVFREPVHMVERYRQRLGHLGGGLSHALTGSVRETHQVLDDAGLRMAHELKFRKERVSQQVSALASQLRSLSPVAVLERGYSITMDAEGAVVRRAGDVKPGQTLRTQVSNGTIESEVRTTDDSKSTD